MTKTRKCAVPHCESYKQSRLFTFPTLSASREKRENNIERCRLWVSNSKNLKLIGQELASLHGVYFICADHFKGDQFYSSDRKTLIPSAVPTEFPSCPGKESCNETQDGSRQDYCSISVNAEGTTQVSVKKSYSDIPVFHDSKECVSSGCCKDQKMQPSCATADDRSTTSSGAAFVQADRNPNHLSLACPSSTNLPQNSNKLKFISCTCRSNLDQAECKIGRGTGPAVKIGELKIGAGMELPNRNHFFTVPKMSGCGVRISNPLIRVKKKPTTCSIPGCGNRGPSYAFPEDETRANLWLTAINRDDFKPSRYCRVCKQHFKLEDFELARDKVHRIPVLKKDAVPSLFTWAKKGIFPHHNNCKNRLLCINHFIHAPIGLLHLTGLKKCNQLRKIFNIVGDCASYLYYYPDLQQSKRTRIMQPPDELFLTLIKLYKDWPLSELAQKFNIPISDAASVFITWVNLLYCVFKEIDIGPNHTRYMSGKLNKCHENVSTVALHCVEISLLKPRTPFLQQLTHSSQQGGHTVKVLVGVCACGAVLFVSKAHGGSISCDAIFEGISFPDFLDGEYAECKGPFQTRVSDIHTDRIMDLNDFHTKQKKSQNHFHMYVSKKNTNVSLDRTEITKLIGVYAILSGQLCTSDLAFANRIIFVSFMLVNITHGHVA